MTVYYEWDVEEVDEHEDIQNHNHTDSFAKAKAINEIPCEEGMTSRIVLVRDDDKGRSWAYLEDGELPSHFEDAYGVKVAKVPERFHEEVSKG
jgi:hypothetical protein